MIREDMLYDVRTIKYRLLRTEYSRKQFNAHLDELPDDAAEAEETETRFVAAYESRSMVEGEGVALDDAT